MLVHCKVTPSINFADTHLYIHLGGERQCESKASCPRTEQSPRPGLKPGLLNLDTGALTMRPPHLSVVFLLKPFSLTEPYDKSLTYTVSNNVKWVNQITFGSLLSGHPYYAASNQSPKEGFFIVLTSIKRPALFK